MRGSGDTRMDAGTRGLWQEFGRRESAFPAFAAGFTERRRDVRAASAGRPEHVECMTPLAPNLPPTRRSSA